MPFAIEEYIKTHEKPVDMDTMESSLNKDDPDQRAIYQYSSKRAKLDLKNIDKQVEKAKKIITGARGLKKNKFIKLKLNTKNLDFSAIKKAKMLAGFKGYITNLLIFHRFPKN